MEHRSEEYRRRPQPSLGLARSTVRPDLASLRDPASYYVTAHAPSPSPRLANLVETKLPWLFLIYAIPSVIVLSLIMPPFQVADELGHIERADQISRGRMISDILGGTIDGSWV